MRSGSQHLFVDSITGIDAVHLLLLLQGFCEASLRLVSISNKSLVIVGVNYKPNRAAEWEGGLLHVDPLRTDLHKTEAVRRTWFVFDYLLLKKEEAYTQPNGNCQPLFHVNTDLSAQQFFLQHLCPHLSFFIHKCQPLSAFIPGSSSLPLSAAPHAFRPSTPLYFLPILFPFLRMPLTFTHFFPPSPPAYILHIFPPCFPSIVFFFLSLFPF